MTTHYRLMLRKAQTGRYVERTRCFHKRRGDALTSRVLDVTCPSCIAHIDCDIGLLKGMLFYRHCWFTTTALPEHAGPSASPMWELRPLEPLRAVGPDVFLVDSYHIFLSSRCSSYRGRRHLKGRRALLFRAAARGNIALVAMMLAYLNLD